MAQSARSTEDLLRMNVETFREEQESGTPVVLLDVRNTTARDADGAKIPGALRAWPELRIDPRWPKDRLILALCTCSQEATSIRVALHLRERGFTRAYALIGGFEAWSFAGLPLELKASLAPQT